MKPRSPEVTEEMACQIKALVLDHGLLQHQAAAVFGINQGRVSEVMSGKRYPGVPPAATLPLGLI
tara:strand:+ start:539 stop:733 length:195 start_codon:yes stop_codon:yes gene_type:complete